MTSTSPDSHLARLNSEISHLCLPISIADDSVCSKCGTTNDVQSIDSPCYFNENAICKCWLCFDCWKAEYIIGKYICPMCKHNVGTWLYDYIQMNQNEYGNYKDEDNDYGKYFDDDTTDNE